MMEDFPDLPDLIDSCHKSNALPEMLIETTKPTTNISTLPSSSSQIFRITNGASTNRSTPPNQNNSDSDDEQEDMEDDDDNCDIEIDDDDSNLEEDFIGCQNCSCLICPNELSNPELTIGHMITSHSFDLVKVCLTHNLDQIGYIKLINYLRLNQSKVNDVKESSFDVAQIDDHYMVPHNKNDALLRFDIESYMEELKEQGVIAEVAPSTVDATLSIQAELDELRNIVTMQNKMIHRMRDDMLKTTTVTKKESASDLDEGEDAGYFESYSSYEIHQEMLQDKVRTESYRDAILLNESVLKDSRVLDVGCGTGILSMFCAKAGAKSVDAVDLATVAYDAMEIVRTNKLDNIVTVRHGRLESQHFGHKFDVIVSEWMGYFLLFEGMLDSVIYARDRFLKAGGTMMPNRCTMHISAIDDKDSHHAKHQFWRDVYGFDMSCISKKYVKSATIEVLSEEAVATSTAQIVELDMNKCTVLDTNFKSTFTLTAKRTTDLVAFSGYFDTYFDLADKNVMFSTGPHATPTHWKQTVFYLPSSISVKEGEDLEVNISVHKMKEYTRGLTVSYTVRGNTHTYTVD